MSKKKKVITDTDQETFTQGILRLSELSPQNIFFQTLPSSSQINITKTLKGSNSIKSNNNTLTLLNDHSIKEKSNWKKVTSNHLHSERQINIKEEIKKTDKTTQKSKRQTGKLIMQNNNVLQGIIKGQKIKKLQQIFVNKIGRTSTACSPVNFDISSKESGILMCEGIELSPLFLNVIHLISVCQLISLLFVYSVSLVFQDLVNNNKYFLTLQIGSLIFYFTEIIINLLSIKSEAGRKVVNIKEIVSYYMNRTFWIDIIVFLQLLIDISTDITANHFFRLFIICKLPQFIRKVEKLQVYFIRNIYNEQYWQLAKVFIVNFCIAHVICIFLAAMAKTNPPSNWMLQKGIQDAYWTQKYTWSFYWAVNIMLTVGFGDISATNSSEALCLIFIETFSCIVMAYNINCVGGIISNLRFENSKRSKKFKIFKKLADQNFVPQELQFQIINYIEQSSNLKKIFNYQEEKQLLNELPETLRVEYLKESNHKILKGLVFFRDLLERTLYNFAEHLEVKVAHPQQIIRHLNSDFNLTILKEGQIGYICKKQDFKFNSQIVDLIKVRSGETPFLTGLDFISKVHPQFQIKSLKFSVLYQMEYNRFIEVFKESDMDYELFCFLRDKIRNIPDQFEVLPCQFCNKRFNHFKFTCPKLHYVPFEQHVINKQLRVQKMGNNVRTKMKRCRKQVLTWIQYYSMLKDYRNGNSDDRSEENFYFYQRFALQKQKRESRPRTIVHNHLTSRVLPKIESIIDNKTRQIIEMEFLRKQKLEWFEDDVWDVQLDILQDFNSYFPSNNPHLLADKFNPQLRQKKKIEKFNAFKLATQSFHDEIPLEHI